MVFNNTCDFNPQFNVNIDSLKKHCSADISLSDLLNSDSLRQSNFKTCMIESFTNEINWDFKITIELDGYQLDWQKTPLSIQSVEVETGFQERGKYPFSQFYKGYEVQISDSQTITVLFFNAWVGGCLHDFYVWELVELE